MGWEMFPGAAFHNPAETPAMLQCCRVPPVHAVDHVPVIVMAEVLRIPQNFLTS